MDEVEVGVLVDVDELVELDVLVEVEELVDDEVVLPGTDVEVILFVVVVVGFGGPMSLNV